MLVCASRILGEPRVWAADAHDARLLGLMCQRPGRLMLMMLTCWALRDKGPAATDAHRLMGFAFQRAFEADAHDACLLRATSNGLGG